MAENQGNKDINFKTTHFDKNPQELEDLKKFIGDEIAFGSIHKSHNMMFNKNKDLYAKLYAIKENSENKAKPDAECMVVSEPGVETSIPRVETSIIKDPNEAGKPCLLVKHLGDAPFACIIRDGKITLSDSNLNEAQMTEFRNFLRLRGIEDFSFDDKVAAPLKEIFEKVDQKIKDNPSFWDDWHNALCAKKNPEAVLGTAPDSKQEEILYWGSGEDFDAAEVLDKMPGWEFANDPSKKKKEENLTDRQKFTKNMNNFAKKTAKYRGKSLLVSGNLLTGSKTYRFYEGDAYKEGKPGQLFRERNEPDFKIKFTKKGIFYSTKGGKALTAAQIDEIVKYYVFTGQNKIEFGDAVIDAEVPEIRKACARKFVVPVGVSIAPSHVPTMIEEAAKQGAHKHILQDYKLRLADQIEENNSKANKPNLGLVKKVKDLRSEVRFERFGDVAEDIIEHIQNLSMGRERSPDGTYTNPKMNAKDPVEVLAAGAAYLELLNEYREDRLPIKLPGGEAEMFALYLKKTEDKKPEVKGMIEDELLNFAKSGEAVRSVQDTINGQIGQLVANIKENEGGTVRGVKISAGSTYKGANANMPRQGGR